MKKKTKQKQTKSAPAAKPAKALERKRIEVAAHQLRPAPWNPRSEITSESVADITASIREIGLIQPLVVMRDPAKMPFGSVAFYMVVAGHRRFRACVDAGLSPIPCDLIDCDEATARRVTMIENLQRKDADPLMEADLIATLIAGGMTQAEIDAETGRGERWVARRANLVKLSPAWRKRAAAGNVAVDCLEHVAAFPKDMQEKLVHVAFWRDKESTGLRWGDCKSAFQGESRSLSAVLFDTKPCRTCPNNTGCAPDLLDWDGRPSKLGKCLKAACYEKKVNDAIDAEIKSAKEDGVEVSNYRPPYWSKTSSKPTRECTVLHVFRDYGGKRTIQWAEPNKFAADIAATKGADPEADAAAARAKRERNKAIRKLAQWCGDGEPGEPCNLSKLLKDFFRGTPTEAPFLVEEAFSGVGSWHFSGCKTNKQMCAVSAIFGNFTPPFDKWANFAAADIIRNLDPSRCEGVRAAANAELLAMMFPNEILTAIGADAYGAIRGDRQKEDIINPNIKWEGIETEEGEEGGMGK